MLGRFSHFNIAIAYSKSTFCGAWTPSFCEFTGKLCKFQENEHTPVINILVIAQMDKTELRENVNDFCSKERF